MLVINRRIDEEVVIGGNIRVKILGIDGNRVKLGFECPREIDIHRPECKKEEPCTKCKNGWVTIHPEKGNSSTSVPCECVLEKEKKENAEKEEQT